MKLDRLGYRLVNAHEAGTAAQKGNDRMTEEDESSARAAEAGKDAGVLFGRMTRLLVYGNGAGVTACLIMAAAMIQGGVYTAWILAPLERSPLSLNRIF